MNLLKRAFRRGSRLARAVADVPLRRSLQTRRRPARSTPAVDDLRSASVLVVAAHPDDEVIAAAILLAHAPKSGVICVSNGAPRRASYAQEAGFDNRLDYAHARRDEAEAALGLLGRNLAPLRNLGINDQEVIDDLAHLARHLVTPLASGFSHVVTHAYEGGHPDHDSVAFSVHAACALMARAGMTPPILVEAPLYSAATGVYLSQQFVPHEDAGPEASFDLSLEEQDLKQRMLGCHRTQKLSDFHVRRESFRLAPRYHFSAPPHAGDVGFNQFHWPVTGKIWRRAAWRAMRDLDLVEELA